MLKNLVTSIALLLVIPAFSSNPNHRFLSDEYKKPFVVTIDAGHGGKDPGALGKKSKEKDLTLAIALRLGQYIEGLMDNVQVIYTRKTDVFIPLEERANIANRSKSDLFISVHVDGFKSSIPKGTSSFVMGNSKNSKNLELVKNENRAAKYEDNYEDKYGFDPDSNEGYIIFNLYQNTNLKQSLLFATMVQDQLRTKARREDRGVSQESFIVLWRTTMPSVLIETGFISNPSEEEFLMTENGQDIISTAIFTAFRKYKEDLESTAIQEPEPARKEVKTNTDSVVSQKTEPVKTNTPPVRKEENQPDKQARTKPDTIKNYNPVTIKTEAIEKPKTEVSSSGKVEFRVQVLASTRKLGPNSPEFKGRKGLEEIFIDGYYKYMTPPIKTYEEAVAIRKELQTQFKGAFIVPFRDGVKIPLSDINKD